MGKNNSRSKSVLKNTIIGIIAQILILSFSFISRTIFIRVLGAEYLGVNGLYTNILTVLSLAELGIGNVMIYSLYKPVLDNDERRLSGLLNYYKIIYRKIAFAVLLIGILLIPALDIIIKSELDNNSLILYYVLFLMNSVVSYFTVYKTALINADQKNYIIKILNTIVTIIKNIAQIFVLYAFKNYVMYLVIQVLFTIITNLALSFKANKMYPRIFHMNSISILDTDKEYIVKNVKSMFLYRLGVVIMNSTDAILISMILGTIYVGYYSNYFLLITMVTTFIGILIQGIFSSIGNLNAENDMNKSYKVFNSMLLFFHWLSACCSISFILVFNDFIEVWIGQDFLLSLGFVLSIVFSFYIQNLINPVWIYRETMGLFKQIKYLMIIASIINIFLSIYLGLAWGLVGIIISTALSRLLTTVWYEPIILYKTKFNKPVIEYWKKQSRYFVITVLSFLMLYSFSNKIPVSLPFVFLKIFLAISVTTIMFIVLNYNRDESELIKIYTKYYFQLFKSKLVKR